MIAHELCHVRRRDNLTAAIHMVVEAVFWFHPLVWWIGARLLEERERACDEEVLRQLGDPKTYAEGILAICKRYVDPPLMCVSGVTGADLKKRIESIMRNRLAARLTLTTKVVLITAAFASVAGPFVVGMLGEALHAQAGPGFLPPVPLPPVPVPLLPPPPLAPEPLLPPELASGLPFSPNSRSSPELHARYIVVANTAPDRKTTPRNSRGRRSMRVSLPHMG